MGFLERVEVAIDVVTDKASQGISDLKTKVGDAEGGFGKLKAAAGGAGDIIQNNAAVAVTALGTGVATFAVKAIGSFETLALSVDKFTQATGASADEASRWVKVTEELGVSTDAVQAGMGRVNREAASGALGAYGVTAKDTSTQFLQLIEHLQAIPDKDEQARQAFKTLGKSWQELSPLLDTTVNLRDRLAEVSGSNLITADQIGSARNLRDAMNEAETQIQQIVLTVGGKLAPVVTTMITDVEALGTAFSNIDLGPLGSAADFLGNLFSTYNGFTVISTALEAFGVGVKTAGGNTDDLAKALKGVSDQSLETAGTTTVAATATQGLSDNSSILNQHLQDRLGTTAAVKGGDIDAAGALAAYTDATKAAQTQVDAVVQSLTAEYDAVSKNTLSMLDAQNQQIATNQALQTYSKSVSDTSLTVDQHTVKMNDMEKQIIQTAVSTADATTANMHFGSEAEKAGVKADTQRQYLRAVADTLQPGDPLRVGLEGYIAQLDSVKTDITTQVNVNLDRAAAQLNTWMNQPRTITVGVNTVSSNPLNSVTSRTQAAGGTSLGGMTIVGEEGPELVNMPKGANVLTAQETRAALGGGGGGGMTAVFNFSGTFIGTTQAQIEQWIVDSLARYSRRNGGVPITVK
jgi:hypothetical protein